MISRRRNSREYYFLTASILMLILGIALMACKFVREREVQVQGVHNSQIIVAGYDIEMDKP